VLRELVAIKVFDKTEGYILVFNDGVVFTKCVSINRYCNLYKYKI